MAFGTVLLTLQVCHRLAIVHKLLYDS
jgi:hypothetical protein